jgi:hypothetical protein
MSTFAPKNAVSWARQPLGNLHKLRGLAGAYFAHPRMELVPTMTRFGRLEHRSGPLALLLTVAFHNEGEEQILLRSLSIKYSGSWYHPIHFPGDEIHLLYHQGEHHIELPRSRSIIAAPYIPATAVAERFALFRLPEPWERWPTRLQVTARATFVHRRSRSLVVTLTNPA